jgi:hypothetical protein
MITPQISEFIDLLSETSDHLFLDGDSFHQFADTTAETVHYTTDVNTHGHSIHHGDIWSAMTCIKAPETLSVLFTLIEYPDVVTLE